MPYRVLQHPKLWDWWVVHFPVRRVLLLLQPCTCFFLPLSSYHIPLTPHLRSRYFPGPCDMNLIPRGREEDWIWFPTTHVGSLTSGLFRQRQLLPPTALIILWFLSLYCQCPKWNALPFVLPETIPQNCFQFMNGFGYLRTSVFSKLELAKPLTHHYSWAPCPILCFWSSARIQCGCYSLPSKPSPPTVKTGRQIQEGKRGAVAKAPWPSRETASIYVEALGWWS